MGLDLNLLVPLDALLQERSVTKAAARLGLSQPTVSASLARLRRHFGDELLAREGNSYELTPLAKQLAGQAERALRLADDVFLPHTAFDPAFAQREFTLIATDMHVATLGRELAALVSERAPGVRLRFLLETPSLAQRREEPLSEVDAGILPQGVLGDTPSIELYEDPWVCVVSSDSVEGGPPTVEELGARPWVMPFHFPWLGYSPLGRLRGSGMDPRIDIAVENYLTIPYLVIGTDRAALLPARVLALSEAAGRGLTTVDLPFDPGRIMESLWWHPRHDRDPAHVWLRQVVVEAGARVAARPHRGGV
ncbi:LysR family transcriptional regulator [Streptomyces sp. S6]